jgi:hypothetical protein
MKERRDNTVSVQNLGWKNEVKVDVSMYRGYLFPVVVADM